MNEKMSKEMIEAIVRLSEEETEDMAIVMQNTVPMEYETMLEMATIKAFNRGDIPNETEAEYVQRQLSYGGANFYEDMLMRIQGIEAHKSMVKRNAQFKKLIPNPTFNDFFKLGNGEFDGLLEEQGV